MAFRRDEPLVATVERVVQLTGRTDLRNLEASGELDLHDLLRSASSTIHDKLFARGVDPERLVNAFVYENAVAWQFLGVLAEAGSLGSEDPEALFARSAAFFEDVRPRLDEGDGPRTATEGVPAVQNPTAVPFSEGAP
ncbi:MAG: hypothetical protein KDD82_22350 [Planctomycetes bacterium]|nr:hypothetical protein [Planctomycetota bacterium]